MEGAQTDVEEEGVGPPLWAGEALLYTPGSSGDQSWPSLGLSLAYMYIPGVQNFLCMGAKE